MSISALPTILAVDDEPTNLLLLQRVLQGQFRVICSPNGQAALAILDQAPIDVVLLDIMMPQMNGYQVLQAIRTQSKCPDVPVILVSAMSDAKDVTMGLELGANDYITKPIDADVTVARIQTQMSLKALQDERKKVIQELQATQAMREHLLRIASHDLKGPLMNIRMVSSLISRLLKQEPSGDELIETLDESLETMQTVIEDFLDTAAMSAGQIKLHIESVSLSKVMLNLLKLHQSHAAKKDIQIELTESNDSIQADPARFQQALGNLVSNAIKYSPLHSTIRIWDVHEGNVIRICVGDEGPGIPAEEYPRLFTQFGKLSHRPTDGEQSTGLGLWIVKHLIDLQGGVVGVDCPPEGGSIFWIKLLAA